MSRRTAATVGRVCPHPAGRASEEGSSKDGLRGGRPAAAFSALIRIGAGGLLVAGLLTPL